MRRLVLLTLLVGGLSGLSAQTQLTIDACRQKARSSYPLSRKYGLIDRAAGYSVANLLTGYLPQVTLSGKRTTQSDVNPMSGLPEDQYQLSLELSQTLWDGGLIWAQRNLRKASAQVDRAQVDVDLYALDRRVDQLFFSILLISAQLDQNLILQKELGTNADRVSAYLANGIATVADADAIEVERVSARQDRVTLEAQLKSYTAMLAALLGEAIPEGTVFVRPAEDPPSGDGRILARPELSLFSARRDLLSRQVASAIAADSPGLSVFFQGLWGDPRLNSLASGPGSDYVAGIRFSWTLGSLYTLPGTLAEIGTEGKLLETEREAFLVNANLDVLAAKNEVERLRALIEGDQEIIALRGRIKKSAEVRVSNGTLSVPDLIREISAENLAVQVKLLHEIQLQMAIREYQTLVKG